MSAPMWGAKSPLPDPTKWLTIFWLCLGRQLDPQTNFTVISSMKGIRTHPTRAYPAVAECLGAQQSGFTVEQFHCEPWPMPLWLGSTASQLQRTITSDTVPYYSKSERKITVQKPAWSPAYLSMWTRRINLNMLDIRLRLQMLEISAWIGIWVQFMLAYKYRALIFSCITHEAHDTGGAGHWVRQGCMEQLAVTVLLRIQLVYSLLLLLMLLLLQLLLLLLQKNID